MWQGFADHADREPPCMGARPSLPWVVLEDLVRGASAAPELLTD